MKKIQQTGIQGICLNSPLVFTLLCLILIPALMFQATAQDEKEGKETMKKNGIAIVPKPVSMTIGEGAFELKKDTAICAGMGTLPESRYLADILEPAMGYRLNVSTEYDASSTKNSIILSLDPSLSFLGEEGYRLNVSAEKIEVRAAKPAGIFYAIQTLRQLLPIEIFSNAPAINIKWTVPCLDIEDKPRFEWRGQLLDCCRHFFDKETVKRSIDLLALHKMNRLHWHLTEDQGWRVEIKRYPKLAEIGAWRIDRDGQKYGGYYSQDDIREIVEYAAARHITVVPEIEMPGHSTAVLASYPELGCTGGPYIVANWWGVYKDVYCAGNEMTFAFIENVLDEVLHLFPSQYIHIGGDECPKDRWKECPKCQARIKQENLENEHELQSYFIKRIDTYLTENGRRLIGWDEILEGGLAPNAVVQSWRGVKGAVEAAQQGHDVIMSPTSHCYLDYSYATTSVKKSYSYEPIPEGITGEQEKHVLGIEGNIWTEWVSDQERLDFQVFPRLTALSEVAWTPAEQKDWDDFKPRLEVHLKRLDMIGVAYGKDELGDVLENTTVIGAWTAPEMKKEGVTLEWDATSFMDSPGKYEVIFWYTSGDSALQVDWAALSVNGKEIQRDTHIGWSGHDKRNIVYTFNLPEHAKDTKYIIRAQCLPVGGVNSSGDVRIRKAE